MVKLKGLVLKVLRDAVHLGLGVVHHNCRVQARHDVVLLARDLLAPDGPLPGHDVDADISRRDVGFLLRPTANPPVVHQPLEVHISGCASRLHLSSRRCAGGLLSLHLLPARLPLLFDLLNVLLGPIPHLAG